MSTTRASKIAMSYVVCWEFRIDETARTSFEHLYGPDGPWVALFREASAYRGTDLLHDADDRTRYVTVDRWESRQAYAAFRDAHETRYAELDAHGERLTRSERCIGEFTVVPPTGNPADG